MARTKKLPSKLPNLPGLSYPVKKSEENQRANLSMKDVKKLTGAVNDLAAHVASIQSDIQQMLKGLDSWKEPVEWSRLKMTSEKLEKMSKLFGGSQ